MSLTDLNLRQLEWDILWPLKDKVKDIDTRCLSFEIIYKEHGEASELRMQLDNQDRFFTNNYIFDGGMKLQFYLYYALQEKKNMGEFTIDEITDEEIPSIFTVAGISTDAMNSSLRTKKSRAFENHKISDIVNQIGKENGLKVDFQGKDLLLKRKDQKECHDLKFLTDLAELYGYKFKINGDILYFYDLVSNHKLSPAKRLENICSKRTFIYKGHQAVQSAEVRYFDPHQKKLLKSKINAEYGLMLSALGGEKGKIDSDTATLLAAAKGDITSLSEEQRQKINDAIKDKIGFFEFGKQKEFDRTIKVLTQKIDSLQEAETIANAQLETQNIKQFECSFDCQGDPDFIPPFNITIEGEGIWDGTWHFGEATHSYNKQSGYRMILKGYRL